MPVVHVIPGETRARRQHQRQRRHRVTDPAGGRHAGRDAAATSPPGRHRRERPVHGHRLPTAIRSAVAFVAANTTVPLLGKAVTCQVAVTSDRGYVTVPASYIKSVTRVRYWAASQGYSAEPAGEILPATLGRVVLQSGQGFVYPPAGGWPVRRAGSPVLVDVVRGVTVDPDHVLFQAVVVAGREFFQGHSEIPRSHAVYALMASMP